MDDPELALDQHLERLDDDEQEFASSPSDSEVNGPVDSSVEMNSVYGSTVSKDQAYSMYRHAHVLIPPVNSVSGSEDNSSIASFE